jgi:hypothetical protein
LDSYDFDIIKQYDKFCSSVYDGVSYCEDEWHYNGDDMIKIGNLVGKNIYNYEIK